VVINVELRNDYLILCFSGHGSRIVNPLRDHSASPLTFAEDMKIGDKYVVWDGNSEKPYTEDTIGHLCIIQIEGELCPISKILATFQKDYKKPLVPIIVFSCKNGLTATEKEFDGKPRGVFSYFCNALLRRDPKVTFRDAISSVNFDMQQEGLEQRAEVICRIDILDMPMMNVSLPNEVPLTIVMDMCRTELTLAEFERKFKGSESV
jgi:hypothetical protein